jgi:TPR repeat protein
MAGNHDAQMLMGRKLERGEGMPADLDAAVDWYAAAAEAGHVRSALELTRLYRAGTPLHSNDAAIAAAMRQAADGGNPEAMRALGGMYLDGRGVPRNAAMGIALLRRAADGGSRAAAAELARAH